VSIGEFYYSPRNWTEDEAHENGNYICVCVVCKERFLGHKRRVTCKVCANSQSDASVNPGSDEAKEKQE